MDTAAKLAKGLKEDPRAKLEAARLDLRFKVSMYKRHVKHLETMISLLEDGIKEVQGQIVELNNGTDTD